jgi:hypothetical protein
MKGCSEEATIHALQMDGGVELLASVSQELPIVKGGAEGVYEKWRTVDGETTKRRSEEISCAYFLHYHPASIRTFISRPPSTS